MHDQHNGPSVDPNAILDSTFSRGHSSAPCMHGGQALQESSGAQDQPELGCAALYAS